MNGLLVQIWTFVKPLLVPCFLIFSWREDQEAVPSSVPTSSLCGHVHTRLLVASALGGAACNTKWVCGCGCVGAFPGPPAGPCWPPYPKNTPLEHWTPLSVKHHLGVLPRVQPQIAVAMCHWCCHCRRRMWKDTGDSSQSDICWFLTGQNPFTLMLMTMVSFHLGVYYCLFSVLCSAGSTGGVSPRMGMWLCRNVTVAM